MGAGNYAAGLGFAGADPVAAWSPPVILIDTSLAALFDLATKSVLRDATTGLVRRVHWADQSVALALGVRKGTITSAPDIGNELHLIPRNSKKRLTALMTDEVRRSLKTLTDNQDIMLVRIQIKIPVPGRNLVQVDYVNLHTTDPTNRTVTPVQVASS